MTMSQSIGPAATRTPETGKEDAARKELSALRGARVRGSTGLRLQLLAEEAEHCLALQGDEVLRSVLLEQAEVVETLCHCRLQIVQGEGDTACVVLMVSRCTASHEARGEVRFARQAGRLSCQRLGRLGGLPGFAE